MAHKCYISFKTEDDSYKNFIQTDLAVEMIDKSLDEPIQSHDEEYILRRIRQDYLSDSTVTIHLIGRHSAENLGWDEQRFIKRELQASLYNSQANPRNGILGVALPQVEELIFKGNHNCSTCGNSHNLVAVNDSTTVREFWFNYYIPNGKCSHREDERYCVLAPWRQFAADPSKWIDTAFDKRSDSISNKVKIYDL